jgi:hypothetical protein
MQIRLDGRTALITGGSKGLGRAMAEAFLEAGAAVAIVARRQAELDVTKADLAARFQGARIAAISSVRRGRYGPSSMSSWHAMSPSEAVTKPVAAFTASVPADTVPPFTVTLGVFIVVPLATESVAPLATVTGLDATDPALATWSVPADTVVGPVYELAASITSVPAPVFVTESATTICA